MKYIELTQGFTAVIDDDDFAKVSKIKWRTHYKTYNGKPYSKYAACHIGRINGKNKSLLMHRFILNPPKNKQIDHINGNGLDNRKENLRIVSNQQNQFNQRKRKSGGSSKYKGVSFDKKRKKWHAQIMLNYKQIHLGRFSKEIDAARAYDEAVRKHFGEYAKTNLKLNCGF